MKITLFSIGLIVAIIAIIIDGQGNLRVAGIGYFILSSSLFLSSAIWRSDTISNNYCRSIQKVYSVLSEGDLDMERLMKRLVENNTDMGTLEYYQSIIGRMLAKRMIVISNGLVTIGEGIDAST